MTASISETIKKLVDSEAAKIDISTLDGQTIRLNCVYKESHSPNFFLVFPPRKLPENIDLTRHCPVSIKAGETALTLTAKIIEIKGDRTLELVAKNTVKPESLREFFRVNSKIPIIASFEPESSDSTLQAWRLEGRTLDISGSGALAIFPEEPQSKNKITLILTLNSDHQKIECIGHIVRSKRIRRGQFQISFHFDYISAKDKDTIISFCLREQRNQLREKVQTAG